MGQYEASRTHIGNVLQLINHSHPFVHSALWGILSSNLILLIRNSPSVDRVSLIQQSMEYVNSLRVILSDNDGVYGQDSRSLQKAWLLTWTLILATQSPSFKETMGKFLEIALEDGFLAVIQNHCPWLLWYVVVASIVSEVSYCTCIAII